MSGKIERRVHNCFVMFNYADGLNNNSASITVKQEQKLADTVWIEGKVMKSVAYHERPSNTDKKSFL